MNPDYSDMFRTLHPDYFERESIRSLPPEEVFEEQLLDLHTFDPNAVKVPCPANITFGLYQGSFEDILPIVEAIDDSWLEFFHPEMELYCAYDNDRVVGLCVLEDFGEYAGHTIAGPGCIGTLAEYRRQGIGLSLVQKSTAILKERSYDLGYIHYTSFAKLFGRVGYKTVLRWNAGGIVE